MIERDDFDLQVVAWLAHDAGDDGPAYLGTVLGQVERTRQRPAWATVPGWRSVERALRGLDVAPAFLILLLIGLLLVAIAAALMVGTPPPRPGPLIALPEQRQPPPESPRPLPEAARVAELEFRGPDFYSVPRPLSAGRAGTLCISRRSAPCRRGAHIASSIALGPSTIRTSRSRGRSGSRRRRPPRRLPHRLLRHG